VGKKAKAKELARKRRLAERVLAEQVLAEQLRTAGALRSLSTTVAELQQPSGDRLLEEIRRLLDDVLVAQHRTNQLLELALRAGFDDEEQARSS
jgi:hypothetical protein